MDFAKKKAEKDEWFTPEEAIYPILRYLKPNSIIWCPFDTRESNFVKILEKEGHIVNTTHIIKGEDFFKIPCPKECEYIVSNPPYSLRNKILQRLFKIQKPFAMLMNTNGLFDSSLRWNLFKKNNFTLIYLKGRVNYMEQYGEKQKSSPPFQSAYVCSQISDKKIIFEELSRIDENNKHKDTTVKGMDSCSSRTGITDYDIVDEFKIFRCEHYVYCPLCGWKCESERELEKHLDATDSNGKNICEGHWRYGAIGVNRVRNELKYWKLYKKMGVSGDSSQD